MFSMWPAGAPLPLRGRKMLNEPDSANQTQHIFQLGQSKVKVTHKNGQRQQKKIGTINKMIARKKGEN